MDTVESLITALQSLAPLAMQEDYDNSGLLCGDPGMAVKGVLVTLDTTQQVLDEAVRQGCNVVLSHHPPLFRPLKSFTSRTSNGRLLMQAVKNDIALIAMHTNLDNHFGGVNAELGRRLNLTNLRILSPMGEKLSKLVTFVPHSHAARVREALFRAGAGNIGNYDSCSYNLDGEGTYRAGQNAHPFLGVRGVLHTEPEVRVEVVCQRWVENNVIAALLATHPYEEVAYDIYPLRNALPDSGAGMIGVLGEVLDEAAFLAHVKSVTQTPVLRHSALADRTISKVAFCGGSGSFLIAEAARAGADAFVTADVKYHDFFDAPAELLVVDAGHFETEQFTVQLLTRFIQEKFSNFAVLISSMKTNPVNYF